MFHDSHHCNLASTHVVIIIGSPVHLKGITSFRYRYIGGGNNIALELFGRGLNLNIHPIIHV